jgi:hypothetical protein
MISNWPKLNKNTSSRLTSRILLDCLGMLGVNYKIFTWFAPTEQKPSIKAMYKGNTAVLKSFILFIVLQNVSGVHLL